VRTGMDGVGQEETEFALAHMNIVLDQRAIAQAASDSESIIESYERVGTKQSVTDSMLLAMPDQAVQKRLHEKWTYDLLKQCKSLHRMTAEVVRRSRQHVLTAMQTHDTPIDVEVCIVVDNSGSMAPFATYCTEAVVMLMEVFKALEYPFAVATIGDAQRARLLKPLDSVLTPEVGEKILAALTFNESTHIASCMQAVLRNAATGVFRAERVCQTNKRRVTFFITDGLSSEIRDSGLDNLRHECMMELAVLHVRPDSSTDFLAFINTRLEELTNSKMTNSLYAQVSQGELRAQSNGGNGTGLFEAVSILAPNALLKVLSIGYRNGAADITNTDNSTSDISTLATATAAYPLLAPMKQYMKILSAPALVTAAACYYELAPYTADAMFVPKLASSAILHNASAPDSVAMLQKRLQSADIDLTAEQRLPAEVTEVAPASASATAGLEASMLTAQKLSSMLNRSGQ
jgi:hypothetical protein